MGSSHGDARARKSGSRSVPAPGGGSPHRTRCHPTQQRPRRHSVASRPGITDRHGRIPGRAVADSRCSRDRGPLSSELGSHARGRAHRWPGGAVDQHRPPRTKRAPCTCAAQRRTARSVWAWLRTLSEHTAEALRSSTELVVDTTTDLVKAIVAPASQPLPHRAIPADGPHRSIPSIFPAARCATQWIAPAADSKAASRRRCSSDMPRTGTPTAPPRTICSPRSRYRIRRARAGPARRHRDRRRAGRPDAAHRQCDR